MITTDHLPGPVTLSGERLASMISVFAVAVAVAVAPAAGAAVSGGGCTVSIAGFHRGGDVQAHVGQMLRWNEAGCTVRVEPRAVCASGCTIFLGAARVCTAPDARFMFHAPRMTLGPAEMLPFMTAYASAWYPAPIREWFRATVVSSGRDHWVTGAELIRHGLRECGR